MSLLEEIVDKTKHTGKINDAIIELLEVNKIYGDEIKQHVIHDLEMKIERGSFTAIIGQSGSGKSTLLNLIGTLDTPSDGMVIIDNVDVSKKSEKELAIFRNKEIGFIFQQHFLLPEFTVLENVLMPYRISNLLLNDEVKGHGEELLKRVGLEEVIDKKPNEISGGQQQRVAIARALINNPPIVLADEPAASLDSKSTDEVYDLLRELNRIYNTTFVLITHNPRIARKAQRIVELRDGRIIDDYTVNGNGK